MSMDIGEAVRAMKDGKRVARHGWNGVGMWAAYSPECEGLDADKFWSPANRQYAESNGGFAVVRASMTLKAADGSIVMGWSPSGSDTLATDWCVVD
jgi:hypothetical protein